MANYCQAHAFVIYSYSCTSGWG